MSGRERELHDYLNVWDPVPEEKGMKINKYKTKIISDTKEGIKFFDFVVCDVSDYINDNMHLPTHFSNTEYW